MGGFLHLGGLYDHGVVRNSEQLFLLATQSVHRIQGQLCGGIVETVTWQYSQTMRRSFVRVEGWVYACFSEQQASHPA